MRSVVVLPQPDGPSSAKNEPDGTVSLRSSTATKSPNALVTPAIRRAAPLTSASSSAAVGADVLVMRRSR